MPEINETPSIDNEIETLANATFGEEVRQAIIDALIKCYTDVIAVVLSGVKKGDSITDADINQNGELVLTITNNETQTSRTETVGTVVGSDGNDGAGIQSIRLDTTVGSSTYGHLFIQVQGQTETDIGYIIGPKGDPGETAPEHEWNVDGSFSQSSVNPIQNKVITAKLNEIMTDKLNKTDVDSILSTTRTNPVQNKVITSALNGKLNKSSVDDAFSQSSTNPVQNKTITAKLNEIIAGKIDKVSMSSNHVLTSNGSGGVKDSTKLIGNSNYFHSGSDYLALESAVKQYTYSKSESDNKYVQISQIDDELDEESENPVQNKVVAEKFAEFEENYSAPEAALDITSTNAVQNKVITEALNGKVNISDFNGTIFDDIDLVFSNTNGGIYYGGDCPSAPALFIEAEGGVPEYPSGYAYYLSYVDSLYDSDDNPHWHRIANITLLVQNIIPVDSVMSVNSNNPVRNSTITNELNKKNECVVINNPINNIAGLNNYTDENKVYIVDCNFQPIGGKSRVIFVKSNDPQPGIDLYPNSAQFIFTESGNIFVRTTDIAGTFDNLQLFNRGLQVDDALSTTSENPVQNKVIKAAIDEVVSHGVIIDEYISTSSTNPVQNKVIANELGTRESKSNKDDSISELTSDTYDRTHYPSIKCLKTVQNAIPTVPTNISSFTNDAGYLTQHQSLSNYYTKSEVDSDLNGYQTKIDNSNKLSSDLVNDTDQTNKFVTDTDKTNWNNKLSSANGAVKSSNIDNGAVTLQKLESGVIDSTLSTQGAAAEATVTGKKLKALEDLNEPYNLYDRGTVYQIVDTNGNAASGLTIQSDGSLLCKVTYGAGNVRRLLDSARQLSPGTYTLSGKITLNENVTDTTATRSARCQIGSAVAAQTVPLTTERGGSERVPNTGNSGWFKFTATLSEAETFKFSVAPSSQLYCSYSLPAVISDLQLVKGSEIGDYSPNSHTNVDFKLRQEVEKGFENVEAEIKAKAEKSRVDAHIEGLNLSIDRAKADNNRTDGSIAFEGDFYKGMELNVSGYTQPEGVASTLQFYFKVHKTDSTFIKPPVWKISPNTDGVITVPENCEVMSIYCSHFPVTGVTITAPPLGKFLGDKINELSQTYTDIVTLNKNALARLDEAKTFVKRRGRTDTYTPTFTLLHFSDIHGATTALTRLVELKNHLGSKLSDTICTGDMVNDKYEDTMSFWDGVTGAGSILTCIGNHDVHHQGESSYTADQIGQTDTYTRYFAPYKDGWGVTIGENLTYYYKDYPTNKVRLIALNYLLTGDEATAQNTWLQARLAEAKTNGYTVIIAIHCQLQNSNAVDCSFTTFGKTTFGGQLDESYQASVQSFINDGGLFACYISGHTHWDAVAYNSNYPNQLCITVTIAGVNMNDNDQPRITGTITQDAANLIVIDTDIQTLKIIRVGANIDTYLRERNVLTYNYGSHSVVADY